MLIIALLIYFIFMKAFSVYSITSVLLPLDVVVLFLHLQFVEDVKRFSMFTLGLMKDLIYQHDIYCLYVIQYVALYYSLGMVKSLIRDEIPFVLKLLLFNCIFLIAILMCNLMMLHYGLSIDVTAGLKSLLSAACLYTVSFHGFMQYGLYYHQHKR